MHGIARNGRATTGRDAASPGRRPSGLRRPTRVLPARSPDRAPCPGAEIVYPPGPAVEAVDATSGEQVLLVRAGGRACGLPIASVGETMRPLPVRSVAGTPPFVRGVAIVRGEPVPVLDLGVLLTGAPEENPTRFVVVRAGGRHAALAVAAVLGVARLDGATPGALPLVRDACGGALESLRALDGDLLVVLGAARLVPEEASAALARWKAEP